MVASRPKRKASRDTEGGSAHRRLPRRAVAGKLAKPRAQSVDDRRELALAVLGQFRLIFRSAKKHFQWVQERTGVSGAQLWVLAEIRRRPGIRVTELARALAVHQSTVSNLIERLERHGLVLRDRSQIDQRVVQLSLTEKGRTTIGLAPLPLEGVLPDALNSLGREELIDLQRRLQKLTKLMKVRDSTGRAIPLAEM